MPEIAHQCASSVRVEVAGNHAAAKSNGPAQLSRFKTTQQHNANRKTYFLNSIGHSRRFLCGRAVSYFRYSPKPDVVSLRLRLSVTRLRTPMRSARRRPALAANRENLGATVGSGRKVSMKPPCDHIVASDIVVRRHMRCGNNGWSLRD